MGGDVIYFNMPPESTRAFRIKKSQSQDVEGLFLLGVLKKIPLDFAIAYSMIANPRLKQNI